MNAIFGALVASGPMLLVSSCRRVRPWLSRASCDSVLLTMRLPSARTWVVSVIAVAEYGAPATVLEPSPIAMYSIVTLSPALCVWNITLGGAPPGGGGGSGCWKKAPSGIVLAPASWPTTHELQSK